MRQVEQMPFGGTTMLPLDQWQARVAQHPDKPYLIQPIRRQPVVYSWRDVDREARRMAAFLKAQGYPPGSTIALMSKNCAHWIMADLAIWMAGYVSVPLYPNLSSDSIRYILEHSGARLLFVGKLDGFEAMRPGIPAAMDLVHFPHALYGTTNAFQPWDQIVDQTEALPALATPNPDDLATIIYTSGTTGEPKGAMHSFSSIGNAGRGAVADTGFTPAERFFSYLPLAHCAERLLVQTCSLYCGGSIHFAESLDTFKDDLVITRPTVFLAVPRIWNKFQEGILQKVPQRKLDTLLRLPLVNQLIRKKIKKGLGLDACWLAGAGAAPMPTDLLKWFDRLGIRIQEAYAMTENFAYSHYTRLASWLPGSVGQPFVQVSQRISSDGEIQVKSKTLTSGYYKLPDLSKDLFTEDGWLRTGDRGAIDSEDRLQITGRVKDLFKTSKGKYVAPSPIEMALMASKHLEGVCVVGSGLPQPVALATLSALGAEQSAPNLEASLKELLTAVNNQLDPHERLQGIIVLDEEWSVENGLLTPTLKTRRGAVEKRYQHLYTDADKRTGVVNLRAAA